MSEMVKINPLQDQNLYHWMIVDSLRVEDVKSQVYTHEKRPELRPFFANSRFEHLSDVGPVIFNISPESQLLELWQQRLEWRTSAVIFSIPKKQPFAASFEVLLAHLHQLLATNILNKPAFFRFYTSSLWQEVAQQLTENDVHTILGPARSLSWIGVLNDELDGKGQLIDSLSHEPMATQAISSPYSLQSNVFKKWT